MDSTEIIGKLDHVIEKITKSKKFSSVRILNEVRAEIVQNGLQSSANAVVASPIAPPIPTLPNGKSTYVEQNGEVQQIVGYIRAGENVLLTGETGCGKTSLVEHVAELLGKNLYTIQGEDGMRKEDIIGYRHNLGEDAYTYGILPKAMQDDAGMCYWDEPNATPQGIAFVCFRAMDHRRTIVLTDSKGGEEIKAKEGFVFVGAMNEGHGYRGTAELNTANRRRWGCIIKLDYLPEARERKLLVDRTGVDPNIAEKLCSAARQLRTAHKQKTISTPIGTGSLLSACKAIMQGLKIADAIECSIVNQVSGIRVEEHKAVADVIAAHFPEVKKGRGAI